VLFYNLVPNTYTTVPHGRVFVLVAWFSAFGFPHFRNPTRPSDSADEAAEDAQVHEKKTFSLYVLVATSHNVNERLKVSPCVVEDFCAAFTSLCC
jgi:hypothetical protein